MHSIEHARRSLLAEASNPERFQDGPIPRNFVVNENGTFICRRASANGADSVERTCLRRICSPLKYQLKIFRQNGEIDVAVQFRSSGGSIVALQIPAKEIGTSAAIEKLKAKGFLAFERGASAVLQEMYNGVEADLPIVEVAAHQGVQPDGSIILDDRVFGGRRDLAIGSERRLGLSQRGTLEDWKRRVAGPAQFSSAVVFAIAHALSAFIHTAGGFPSAVMNLIGITSKGKTVTLIVAVSTMGAPRRLLRTWHATAAGFEAMALRGAGLALIVDEARIGISAKDEAHVVFALTHNYTKTLAPTHGGGEPLTVWGLSSQEMRAGDLNQGQPCSGDDVRLFALPCAYGDLGVFDRARDVAHAIELAEELRSAADQFNGTAIAELASRLCAVQDWRDQIAPRVEQAKAQLQPLIPDNARSLHRRGMETFAIVAAGGEWASELGVTGWDPGVVTDAAATMFKQWLAGPPPLRVVAGRRDIAQESVSINEIAGGLAIAAQRQPGDTVERILEFLGSQRPVRLSALLADGRPPNIGDANCPVFTTATADVLLISPARLRDVSGVADREAARALRDSNLLVTNGQDQSLRYTVRVREQVLGFYAVSAAGVLESNSNND